MAFCTSCGAKIEDGYAFCTECGAKVDFQKFIDGGDIISAGDDDPKIEDKKKNPPPKWLIPVIAGVLALALAAIGIFVWPGHGFGKKEDKDHVKYLDTDGNMHVIFDDGSVKTVEGEFDVVFENSSRDIYAILEGDELYTVSRSSMKNKKSISDSCEGIYACVDDYLVYGEDGSTVIYNLDDGDSLDVKGLAVNYVHYGTEDGNPDAKVSDLFFATDIGQIWHFSAEDFDTEKVADFKDVKDIQVIYCSLDAELLFYSVLDGNKDTLYVWEGGKSKDIASCEYDNTYFETEYTGFGCCYPYQADFAVLGNSSSDKIIMISGSDYKTVDMDSAYYSSACFPGAANIYDYRGTEIPEGVYLTSYKGYGNYDDDLGYTLWFVGFDGKTKEIGDIASPAIGLIDDTLYFYSGEDELSYGTLTGTKIKSYKVVDDGVLDFYQTGDSIYYLADCESVNEDQSIGKGSIYRISPELSKPVKIDKKASCYYFRIDLYDGSVYESSMMYWPGVETEDGIFTFRGMKYIDYDQYKWKATLTLCSKDGDDSEEMEEVKAYSIVEFDNGCFTCEEYVKTKKDKDIVNVYFFDGKEFKLVLEDAWSSIG